MATQVFTTRGLIDRERLTVKDVVSENETSRTTATEWYLEDELVRRDVHVNCLAPLSLGAESGR